MSNIPDECVEFVKRKEGYFSRAYRCPAGVWTIGWGTTRWDLKTPVKQGDTITPEEGERQLRIELQRVSDALDEAVKVPLTDGQRSALLSWGYNVGTGWITGRGHKQAGLIRLLNQRKYDAIPGQLLLFCRTTGGKALDGLARRRREEAQMWLSDAPKTIVSSAEETKLEEPEKQDANNPEMPGAMPQSVDMMRAEPATDTVKQSTTAKWSSAGILAGSLTLLDGAFGWTKQTAQQVLDAVNDTTGIQTLLGKFAANAEHIGLAFTVIALAVVLVRKLVSASEGRSF